MISVPPAASRNNGLSLPKYSEVQLNERWKCDGHMLKDVGRALVLYRRTMMPYAVYCRKRKGSSDEAEVKQYAGLVGQDCAERILLYRS